MQLSTPPTPLIPSGASTRYRYPEGKLVRLHSANQAASVLTLDIQMRLVSELEDAYWHAHFSQEPYYVAGRGYAQYRPAYELGWSSALRYPEANFADFAKQLEVLWELRKSASLLPWREVHIAVREAWKHAALQIQKMQQPAPMVEQGRELSKLLQPLLKACLTTADDLLRMCAVPMSDFAQQVMKRHISLLHKLARSLQALIHPQLMEAGTLTPWKRSLRSQWVKFASSLSDWEPVQVFELCEMREQRILALYQRLLAKPLPGDVKETLEKHVKQLRLNKGKLVWVRQNCAM